MSAIEHFQAQFEQAGSSLPGAGLGWLASARSAGMQHFGANGLPTPRMEDWKYTNVRALEKRSFKTNAASVDDAVVQGHLVAGLVADVAVFINGRFSAEHSRIEALPGGALAGGLAQSLGSHADLIEPLLGKLIASDANGFMALNTALFADGLFLSVPAGVKLARPVQALYINTGEDDTAQYPRNLIVMGADSHAQLIESYVSLADGVALTVASTEVALGENAELEHVKLQRESTSAYHIATCQAEQQAGSRYITHQYALGARLARNEINSRLLGETAHCGLYGLYMANGRQHLDFHTRVDHAVPRCTSDEFYKGILDGHGRGVFNGQVHVYVDAQQTDAQQSNQNLLLSKNAEIDTKPQLEIYADDVKCSHGATVGQLDEQMLFYLRSRGIDKATAQELLTYGFARDVVDRLGMPEVEAAIEALLVTRMSGAADLQALLQGA